MPAAKPPEFRRRALDLVSQGESVPRVAKDLTETRRRDTGSRRI